ncbi:YwbE family protein [Paraglaciecola sp.]|uniref:YwbE family protein n=1 Tax=Paraglaciecola sp. TaxID=1920173 RepID=UPI0030F3FE99
MSGNNRASITIGANVSVVLKEDQSSGNLTEGVVARILTNSPSHPHGIKVKLKDGQVGRVKKIHVNQ